jgi:hypothetical protein
MKGEGMKKWISAIAVAGVLVFGGALAQATAQPLQLQISTLFKVNNANLLSKQQIAELLPYLREIRALTSFTADDAIFYTTKIAILIGDNQRISVGEAAIGSSVPFITGGGAGTGSSSAALIASATNPMILDGQLSELDRIILSLTERQSNFSEPAEVPAGG